MSNVRLAIDSVLDKDRLRVLVSTDTLPEEAFVVSRSVLRRLLGLKRIKRRAEGLVFSFDVLDIPGFLQLLRKADVSETDVITLGVTNLKDVTMQEHKRLRRLQTQLRQKMKERQK